MSLFRTTSQRKLVYCLRCFKPQENLSIHLLRTCMKRATAEERLEEVQKAKVSNRHWVQTSRTWHYRKLCELLPEQRSRTSMVKALLQRRFFILNLPQVEDDPALATPTTDLAPSVRRKMKETGLQGEFPADAELLQGFKTYLRKTHRDLDRRQEVANVSRFLRYLQPVGIQVSLDFLSKHKESRDFLTALQSTDMDPAWILYYINSMSRFLEYLSSRLDLQKKDSQLPMNCQGYTELLKTMRTTLCKSPHEETGCASIRDCQKILRMAKPVFFRIYKNLQRHMTVTNTELTLYRYFCEALLVFRHMQLPRAVEGLTVLDWVERTEHGGRVVIGLGKEESSSMQIALTKEEEAFFQQYFKQVRPVHVELQSFFVSSSGEAVHSTTQDMSRLHTMFTLKPITSLQVRRVVMTAAETLPSHQQEAVSLYLNPGAAQQPQHVVDTAELLEKLTGTSSADEASTERSAAGKDFSAFVAQFPVSLEGRPPSKRQRVDSGFSEERRFCDKWRVSQYNQRREYLLSHFTHRPSVSRVTRMITQQRWTSNHPEPAEIIRLWRPPDHVIMSCVSQQTWPGLATQDFGEEQGVGVVTTRAFFKGEVVCDYHGKVVTAAEGMSTAQGLSDAAGYLFFFKAGERDMCVNAQTFPCDCHTDAISSRIRPCSSSPNLQPEHRVLKVDGEQHHVVLLKALEDISAHTQLKLYCGVVNKSFLGLDLDWVDE